MDMVMDTVMELVVTDITNKKGMKENKPADSIQDLQYKTLFSAPGLSTSSEIPEEEREEMGISDGLVRISIGLDDDIERTYHTMVECMKKVGVL
jgi:O-acetylhomoserine/O-acetylserine sulfhydrylase-like pyridoxal-dependent enzyme